MFYEEYISLSNDIEANKNYFINRKYYNPSFKKFLLDVFSDSYRNIKQSNTNKEYYLTKLLKSYCDFLKPTIIKPQKLLNNSNDYYVAMDMITNTKYICFKNFCILDFDINKNDFQTKEDILNYINHNNFLNHTPYMLVETRKGFHIYLLDKPREYNNLDTFEFLLDFQCDKWYKLYCYMRGFSIRLNFKEGDTKLMYNMKLVNKTKKKYDLKLYKLFMKHLEYIDNDPTNLSEMN